MILEGKEVCVTWQKLEARLKRERKKESRKTECLFGWRSVVTPIGMSHSLKGRGGGTIGFAFRRAKHRSHDFRVKTPGDRPNPEWSLTDFMRLKIKSMSKG